MDDGDDDDDNDDEEWIPSLLPTKTTMTIMNPTNIVAVAVTNIFFCWTPRMHDLPW